MPMSVIKLTIQELLPDCYNSNGFVQSVLTPEGDCHGLYVRGKTAKSFEVRELQRGTHSIGFSYRIVGKRKDIKNHTRFAKIDPEITVPRARLRRGARILGRSSTSLRALPAILARPTAARSQRSLRRRRRMPKGR